MGALTEVPRLRSFSLMCASPVFSHRCHAEPLLRTQHPTIGVRHRNGNLMLHALIFFGAHAALLVVVLLVG